MSKQSLNAEFPILVTESGIDTEVMPQSLNAEFPTFVTELGIVTDLRPEQLENAPSPMLVTVSGITILSR